jgi:hypothetical protein
MANPHRPAVPANNGLPIQRRRLSLVSAEEAKAKDQAIQAQIIVAKGVLK